ncbi:MAG TPA: hypothetical protein VK932_03750 [Kofleriaceae bacterium]|nr:hypothetical protein [Kofleriaceae bacterium]
MQPRTDPERQIEQARASLVAHLGELSRRFKSVRERLDLRAKIAAHPLPSVAVAFAVGALLGMRGGRRRESGEAGLGHAVAAALGALGVRLAKELATRRAADAARAWWERRQQAMSSEFRTSYEPGVEPFLRR